MKSLKSIVFFLLILPAFASAQSGKISGHVIDKSDNTGLEFATLTLFNSADSSVVNGTVSTADGSYSMDKLAMGNYFLRVNFIGYEADTITGIQLKAGKSSIDLGAIELTNSSDLTAVDITTEKSAFENRIDKKVFNADQSLAAKGGTGIDLLRQVPSVTVDENGQILLRGDANVTILIDGRPSAMPASELMKQIPASAIEKVELITNPSAKYDPEGMSGIINIILKKNKLEGFNGTINASTGYSVFPKAGGSIALNYRNDKINISGGYNYDYRRTWFGGDLQRDVLIDSTWDRLRSEDYGERNSQVHGGNIGFDYFINDYNTFYITGNYSQYTNIGTREIDYQNVDGDDHLLNYSRRNGEIDVLSPNAVLNTGWQKTFKKPDHTLDLDINYANTSILSDEQLSQSFYDQLDANNLNTFQNTREDKKATNLISKLDYVLPVSDSLTLEAGFHFTSRGTNSEFYSESAVGDDPLIPDANLNNIFKYQQDVFASYFTLGRQFKKIGIKAGLRVENTFTISELINTGEVFNNDYFQAFPSVHLSYKTKNYSEFQLSYSKRINRPLIEQLNPFTNYSDPITLQRGNPFLRPEIIHVNEVSYMKYWKNFNLSATVYHRIITNLIRRNLTYEGIYSTVSYNNIGNSNLSGGDLILTFTPKKGLRIMSSTNVWNTSTDDPDVTGGERKNYFGMQTALQAFYQLKGGWTTQLWASYAPPFNVIQGVIAPNYGGGFAVQKQILKNRGTVNLSIVDVLRTRRFRFDSYDLGNYSFISTRRWESRTVYLSFTYNFGKFSQGKTKRNSKSNDATDDSGVPQLQ